MFAEIASSGLCLVLANRPTVVRAVLINRGGQRDRFLQRGGVMAKKNGRLEK